MQDLLICPTCKTEIPVAETLSQQLRGQLQVEFDADAKKKTAQLAAREENLTKQQEALEAKRQSLEDEIAKRLAPEREKLKREATEQVKGELSTEIADYQAQLADAKGKVQTAQKAELELRKQKRELEVQQQEFDLTVARRVDEEKASLAKQLRDQIDEERKPKDAEKDKLIADMTRQIDDLKRKSEQGSQQLQGEVMELELEEMLRRQFPLDKIVEVAKGVYGADAVHTVFDGIGTECGVILWESKRAKAWSDGWLPKLRDDQRAKKAQIAILATFELPKAVKHFGCVEGVWVTHWNYVIGLAMALRHELIETAKARKTMENRHDKMEILFTYLSGPEFRLQVEGIVEAFTTLRGELESEKKAMNRIWKNREKQLDRVLLNTSGMYGSLQGIIGASLPTIKTLELPAPAEEE